MRGHGTISLGKVAELHVRRELLLRGANPYTPVVDTEAVDAVIRGSDGNYIEIQVKSVNTPKYPRWFNMKALQARDNYFVVCVAFATSPMETWVIPSTQFRKYATYSPRGDLYDLDLDATARGETVSRGVLLKDYLEAWHLLVGQADRTPVVRDGADEDSSNG